MTANGANMKILWSSSAKNDVIFMVIFIFSFCHFLPCTKVFLPAGKIMVKSPVITPHGKNLTTLDSGMNFVIAFFFYERSYT